MANPLNKYARHVQGSLEDQLGKHIPYTWCLQKVIEYMPIIHIDPSVKTHHDVKRKLVELVRNDL